MQRLLMVAPAPVIRTETGYLLDHKFTSGMETQCRYWPGQMDCLLREGAQSIPFGAQEVSSDLPFGLKVLRQDEEIAAEHLEGYDLIYCGIDDASSLGIVDTDLPSHPRIFATIEYTLRTRLQAAWLNSSENAFKRIRTILWLLKQEPKRRRFVAKADGLQTNGYPASLAYGSMNANPLLYLDNRMTPELFATDSEVAERTKRLCSGEPLRLVYSGRLERMKGAHDLLPIAKMLASRGLNFHLDIFGDGGLRSAISNDITRDGLDTHVTLHAPIDFETELVPFVRANSDIYLCCHRQSDPSCSYLENMGCGLAVVGFGNQMWASLNDASGAGWVSPMGSRQGIVQVLQQIDKDREEVIARCDNALKFAKAHDFVSEFEKRMLHLTGD